MLNCICTSICTNTLHYYFIETELKAKLIGLCSLLIVLIKKEMLTQRCRIGRSTKSIKIGSTAGVRGKAVK